MRSSLALRTHAGLISMLLVASACGGRSGLPEPAANEGGAGSGGGAPVDPCAPPVVNAACAEGIAQAPAGSEVWSVTFELSGLSLIGPAAADTTGGTYYLAAESGLYVKTVYALDACGALRWEADVASLIGGSGYVPQVMIAGGHLLLVGVGNIVALDLETGAHAWTADLEGFAAGGGLGVKPGKVVAMGYATARADGTLFTLVANDLDVWIVEVRAEGEMRPVASVKHYLSGAGYPVNDRRFIIDAGGHVVLATPAGSGSYALIHAFTQEGETVFSASLSSGGLGTALAAGPDYLTGRDLWILNLDGTLRSGPPNNGLSPFLGWEGSTAIDEQGTLYAVGAQVEEGTSNATYNVLGSLTPDGAELWRVTLDEQVLSGPVLGDHDRLFAVTSAGFEPGSSTHLVAYSTDGSPAFQTDLGPSGERPIYWMLQNAAGALTLVTGSTVRAFSSGGSKPPGCAFWPTPQGDPGQRACAQGR